MPIIPVLYAYLCIHSYTNVVHILYLFYIYVYMFKCMYDGISSSLCYTCIHVYIIICIIYMDLYVCHMLYMCIYDGMPIVHVLYVHILYI